MKNTPILLSYKSKNYNHANNSLNSKFPILTDFNSFSYNKNRILSTNNPIKNKSFNKSDLAKSTYNSKINKHSLLNVFKDPKQKIKQKPYWPKITQPKMPFSKREKIPPEERKKIISEQKPNRKYHDFYTIKWLRNKYSDSLIEKSVFSMLPDNGKPVVPEDETESEKKHRLLMEFVDNLYKKIPEKEKYVNINPKYFFDQKTFQKILKFKEIFLEFDEDQSRKMEIDEMVEMFNQNHINANLEDLRNLFFKDKRVKKEDIMKLYLDFYQFMNFALTKDQDFREFMREIKLKKEKNNDKDEKERYLPMNFNLMFDYFLMKGKERASIEEIEKGISEMDKIIMSNNTNNKKDEKNENEDGIDNKKDKILNDKNNWNDNYDISNKNKSNETINKINIDYEKQLSNLNFVNLIQNFATLFHINESSSKAMSDSFRELAADHQKDSGIKKTKLKEDKKIKISIFTEEDALKNKNKSQNKKNEINESTSTIYDDKVIEQLVKYNINRKILKNLNMNNYKKFHNVNLAINQTKNTVDEFIKAYKKKNLSTGRKNNFSENKTKINDRSLLESDEKNNYTFNKKSKISLKINPIYLFNKKRNFINKNSNTNYSSNSKDINNFNNIKINNQSGVNSINSYITKSKINNYLTNNNRLDFVPPELLKEKKRRYFQFFP
jgi:hypothetical protein